MNATPSPSPEVTPDAPAGPGPSNGTEAKAAPTGRRAVDAAAEHRDMNADVQANALAYFMGEEPPPGRDELLHLNVDFGTKAHPNPQPCVFRALGAEELDKCEELAQEKNKAGMVERVIPYVRWSYVFAYSCQQPDLGRALTARRDRLQAIVDGTTTDPKTSPEDAAAELARLTNAAALVREVFRFQPGVLQEAIIEVEKRSRMGDPDDRSVTEVEAGKISS